MKQYIILMIITISLFFPLNEEFINYDTSIRGTVKKKGMYYIHNEQMLCDNDVAMMASLHITDFFVEDNHPLYRSFDGVLYSKDGTKLIAYPAENNRRSYQIIDTCVEICPFAFSYSNLSFIEFPQFWLSNVKTIGKRAFWGSNSLLQICLPSSIEKIDDEAFGNCNEDIIFIVESNSYCCLFFSSLFSYNTIIVHDYFDICDWIGIETKIVEYPTSLSVEGIYQIIDGVLFQDDILLGYPMNKKDEEYIIPNGVTSVIANIFQNRYIKKLSIPSSCGNIISFNQYPDGQLEFINVETGNSVYSSLDGVLYASDFSVLYCYPKNKNASVFLPPTTVKIIASSSFSFCKVQLIVLPEGT